MTDNRTTELESLSKLKMAGRLRYWRGTIEIPESELHAICDEIQAEYDRAVAAMNKAAGNWAKADALLRERMSGTLTAEQVREVIERHVKFYEGGDYDEQAIADELNARAERTCKCVSEYVESPFDGKTIVLHRCSVCHELMRPHMRYCPNCGVKVVDA